jgi:hypothetical protein
MVPTKEQPVGSKFCVNLGKIATETLAMITKSLGKEALAIHGCLNDIFSLGQAQKKSETGEKQNQEHVHTFH